jgi:uncharacterized protein YijF (DUF1287 family)
LIARVFWFLALGFVLAWAGTIDRFIDAARAQVGKTVTYDPAYVRLKYPGGDIPIDRGVCTDVVVRALRGVGIDMQERIYKHKRAHPALYKGLYYTDRLDPNIDHRRVKNLQAYFAARGYRVRDAFRPGDIVVWKLPGSNLDHIGICSDRKNRRGEPLIIHNVGRGAQEEDVLRAYTIVDHFRLFKQ